MQDNQDADRRAALLVVQDFWTALNGGDLATAYRMLSNADRAAVSLQEWSDDNAWDRETASEKRRPAQFEARLLPGDEMRVRVQVALDDPRTEQRPFVFTYQLVREA